MCCTGSGMLKIDFVGELNDKMKGFYRSKYTTSAGEIRYAAVTQFEVNWSGVGCFLFGECLADINPLLVWCRNTEEFAVDWNCPEQEAVSPNSFCGETVSNWIRTGPSARQTSDLTPSIHTCPLSFVKHINRVATTKLLSTGCSLHC